MRAVDVVGVRVEMPSNQPIVLLRDTESERFLPIWIGAVEATAIAFAQQGVQHERPLTHDLLRDVITALGRTLLRVDIVDLRDGIFFAELVFDDGVSVSARPSDAIALALRTGSPLFAAEHVLDEAGIEMPAEEEPEESEAEVEAFREFLDQVTPEDFEGGSPH
ncbi:MAG TPA: bifunctional nuclease family protein [Actinomycetota bacterium]|nr:bifunctional nuclease family protein [Actinomycetota bacterium]